MGDVIDLDSKRRGTQRFLTTLGADEPVYHYVGTVDHDERGRCVAIQGVLDGAEGLAMTADQADQMAALLSAAANEAREHNETDDEPA